MTSRDHLSPWNSSKIPTHNKYGTILNQKERALIAKKMGLCFTCETQTHIVHIFRTTPVNDDCVHKGVCIKCNPDRVPPERYRNYKQLMRERRRLPPSPSNRNQSGRSFESAGTEGTIETFEFPGTFVDGFPSTPISTPTVKSLPRETVSVKVPPKTEVNEKEPQTHLKQQNISDLVSPANMPAKPPELFPRPRFYEAAPRPIVTVRQEGTGIEHEEEVFLVRNSRKTVAQAYRKLEGKQPMLLGNNGLTLGEMVICVVLPRLKHSTEIVFEEPDPNEYKSVAIKKWMRMVVDPIVQEQGSQNPYNEISIMQTYGKKDSHVPECVEALIDSHYVYVVWPYCSFCKPIKKRLLVDIQAPGAMRPGVASDEAKQLFLKLLAIVEYLQKSHICHRNLSPVSVAEVYGTESFGHCKLHDFTSSLRIPYSEIGRHFITPGERCGELAYMAPEVCHGKKVFDGFAVDVWSMGTILFELLTGRSMCHMPHVSDRCFLHFVLNRGLTNEDANLRMQEYLMDQPGFAPDDLALTARAVLGLDGTARDLLQGMLEFEPTKRLNLMQVKQHPWLR